MEPEGTKFGERYSPTTRGKAFWMPDPTGRYLYTVIPRNSKMYASYARAIGGNEDLLESPSELAPIDWMDNLQRGNCREFTVGKNNYYVQPFDPLHARLVMIDSRAEIVGRLKKIDSKAALPPTIGSPRPHTIEQKKTELIRYGSSSEPKELINYQDAVKIVVANGVKKIEKNGDLRVTFSIPRDLLQNICDYFLDIGQIQQCDYTLQYENKRGLEYDFNVEMEHVLKRMRQFRNFGKHHSVFIGKAPYASDLVQSVNITMSGEAFADAFGNETLQAILNHRAEFESRSGGAGYGGRQ